MTIIEFILAFGILWGFAVVYMSIKYKYGVKIKQKAQEMKEDRDNRKLVKEFNRKIEADIAKSMTIEIQEADVEDMGRVFAWDNVTYKKNAQEEIISFELEIIENGNS